MATCPVKLLDEWKSLVEIRGEEISYYLWDKYEGNVPESEYSDESANIGNNPIFYDKESLNKILTGKAISKITDIETDIPIRRQKDRLERIGQSESLIDSINNNTLLSDKEGNLYTAEISGTVEEHLKGEALLNYYEDGLNPDEFLTYHIIPVIINKDSTNTITVNRIGIGEPQHFNVPSDTLYRRGFSIVGEFNRNQELNQEVDLWFQKENLPASKSSPATISLMKQTASKMGIDIQRLSDYVKGNPNVETKGINGLADLMKGVIAIAEGKEGTTLTEETVHIATSILEQINPSIITEMISKIDRFGIYKRTLESYKNDKNYQLENGKPNIRKIKKEAVDKLISELIVNQNEGDTQFPELMLEANRSVIRNWWNKILDVIKGIYKKANIDIFNEGAKKITNDEIGTVDNINQNQIYLQNKAEEYTANEINESFKSKDNKNERKFNRSTDLSKSFGLLQREGVNKYSDLLTTERNTQISGEMHRGYSESISYYKGILGRSFRGIFSNEKRGTDMERTAQRYSNLRVIQSLNENKFLGDLARRLGVENIRIVTDKDNITKSPLFTDGKTIYINEDKWVKSLEEKFNRKINLDEYVDVAVFEELIHIVANKLYTEKQFLDAESELKGDERLLIDKFYFDVDPQLSFSDRLDPFNRINELIRMKVQKDLMGNSTEDIANKSFIDEIVHKIWNYIMNIFKTSLVKSNKIAEDVKQYILSNRKVEGEENNKILGLPQLKNSIVDKMYDTIIDMDSRLYLNLIDNVNDKRHYTFDGDKVAKTVTEKVKENQHIPERNSVQKINDESMKYWGTEGGHAFQQQDITKNLIDKDGYARKDFLNEEIDSPLDVVIVEKLKDFNRELIRSYREGTRFIIERKVINTKEKGMLASTVDFKALVPITKEDGTQDMKIDNFDWKFISVNKDKYDDIHWKKQESWKSQMGEYTKIDILYGAKPNQIRKSRMIPFVLNYEYNIHGDNKSGLYPTSIEIGKLDTTGETNLYLLPVSIDTESTGNFERDELLKSLDVYYDKLARRKVSPNEKDNKTADLKELAKAIRVLRMRGDYAPLANIGKTFLQNASRAFKAFENIDYSTLTKEDIYNKTGELLEFKASAEKFASLDETFLSDFPKGDLNDYGKKILTSLESISSSTERMMKKIIELQKEYVVFIASKEGIDKEEILSPEKEVRGILKNLTEASKLSIRSVKLLTKMLLDQRKEVNIQMGRLTKEFSDLLIPLEIFAKSKGKSAFDLIGRANDGKLSIIKKIDPAFWEEFSKETLAGNKEFLLKNINLEAYKILAKERIEKRIEDIEHKTFSSEEEENINMRNFAISTVENELNIESKNFNGYTSHSFSYLFDKTMKTELHYSSDYQELLKSKEAYNMWEFFTSLDERGIQNGYLNHNDTSFFALVEASILHKLSASSDLIKESGDLFKDLYTVRINEESEFSILDKETGKPRQEIPKLFTRTDKEVHQLSRDLTKVTPLWIKTLLEYEARINMENTANTMLVVERAKGHLMVDSKNKLIEENGVFKVDKNSNTNADIFQTIINDNIYGLREDLSSIGNLSMSSVAEKFSKTDEQAQNKVTSAKKAMENANMLTQALGVGGKLAIAAPNYFGNHFQSIINNKGFYTYPEFFKNHIKLIISNLTTVQKGILDLIVPLNGDPSMELRRKMAGKQGFIKWLGTWTMQEAIMSTNYLPERNLQYTNALSFIDNAIVIDGKILNIRQYLRRKEHSRYTEMNQQERRTFEKSLGKRVAELKEKSLAKIAIIENDQIVIPGVSDEELARFTTQIVDWGRNLNGQMSQEDKAGYRRDIMLKSLAMFRNWIVRQVTIRGHDISKNIQTGEWEYGRTRLFIKTWQKLGFWKIFNMRQIILGTDKGLTIMDEMLEQKRDAYYKKTGFHLKITNEEFYDTMRQALSNEMKELGMLFGLIAVVIGAKLAAPDKDEDPLTKNKYKYFARIINKISNEVDFYYNPISFVSMTKGNFLPALGLLVKAEKAMTSLGIEAYGYTTGNEELMKKSYPTKQFLDMIPGASQFEREWLPLIAPDLAKEMGIVVTVQPRIQQ